MRDKDDTAVQDAAADLITAGVVENDDGPLGIGFSLAGPVPLSGRYQYAAYLDMDDNSETGGALPDSDISVEFPAGQPRTGIELVVAVDVDDGIAESRVWVYKDSGFVSLSDPGIRAEIAGAGGLEDDDADDSASIQNDGIVLSIPRGLLGNTAKTMKFQAYARNVDEGGIDILGNGEEEPVLNLARPQFARAGITPLKAAPVQVVEVEGAHFPPLRPAKAYLDNKALSITLAGKDGDVHSYFAVPTDTLPGQHLVSLRADGVTAETVLEVLSGLAP